MVILLISGLIGAVIASIWYSREKQKIRDEYQKQMEQYLNQIEEPQQQTVEEHYTFFFKVKDRNTEHTDYEQY